MFFVLIALLIIIAGNVPVNRENASPIRASMVDRKTAPPVFRREGLDERNRFQY